MKSAVLASFKFASGIVQGFASFYCANPRTMRPVSWTSPGTGKLKLNADGSSKGNPGLAGVFCEERGHWILGFLGRLEDCMSLEAEVWRRPHSCYITQG